MLPFFFIFKDISCRKYISYMHLSNAFFCVCFTGNTMKLTKAGRFDTTPPGYHSVTGVTSAGGLKHKEYVVYKSQQVKKRVNFWVELNWKLKHKENPVIQRKTLSDKTDDVDSFVAILYSF